MSPPYVSYMTFRNLLEWLESEEVPLRFDRSFWSKKYSGSVGPQLMSGLRFLNLLIEERPTPLLERLISSKGDDRKTELRAMYREAYGAVDFNTLQRATPGMLKEWFESYAIVGATVRKATAFFINALKDADEPLSNALRKLARNKKSGGTTSRSTGSRRNRTKIEPQTGTGKEKDIEPPTPAIQEGRAQAQASLMLWGLFKKLPEPGAVFSQPERKSWLEAATVLFNLEYKIESQHANNT